MVEADLETVRRWLRTPHVAHWFLGESSADAEIDKYRDRITRTTEATAMRVVELDSRPIGWCQWYRWADQPDGGAAVGALSGEVGADYAIGEASCLGRGAGTALIGSLVAEVRHLFPDCGLVVTPEAANMASRRVLEKNGFTLISVRSLPTETHDRPMAIYRLPPG